MYGAEGRARTGDLLITSQLHYQLCYFGIMRELYNLILKNEYFFIISLNMVVIGGLEPPTPAL